MTLPTTKKRGRPEADLAAAITFYLECDGWTAVKMEPLSGRGVAQRIIAAVRKLPLPANVLAMVEATIRKSTQNRGGGEPGMPDYLYVRYSSHSVEIDRVRNAQAFWIEHKAPKGKPTPEQRAWHAAERAKGALVLVGGVDFTAALDGFAEWYRTSGLERNAKTVGR